MNIHPIIDQLVSRRERELFLNHRAHVFWLTGLSGSGKSTIGKACERILFNRGYFVQLIDGDNVRTGLCNNLGFSLEDRNENIRRIAELAKMYTSSGIINICSFISPTRKIRQMARDLIGPKDFSEIYVNTSLEECERRDVKGLYEKARNGEIKGFTGIDSPYEAPETADLELVTMNLLPEQSAQQLCEFIIKKISI